MKRIVEPETAGSPMNEERWTRSSLSKLKEKMEVVGHKLSEPTISRLLKSLGFGLKSNHKQREAGSDHADRDTQFRYIKEKREEFTSLGLPIISVDVKKKELIGNFKNPGQDWSREAEEVNVHDFPSQAEWRAVPFGIYDVNRNEGSVYVGTSFDTPEYAASCVVRWWEEEGRYQYPEANQLLVLADGGGSNSCQSRVWKLDLQIKLSDRLGLDVTVCHYPPGCSKYHPIEHRLFSYISLNWAGHPLRSLKQMLGYIQTTTTKTGLKVKAFLQEGVYEKGRKVSDAEMKQINLNRHSVCPKWNYTIRPRSVAVVPTGAT